MIISFSEGVAFLDKRLFQLVFQNCAVKSPLALAACKTCVDDTFLVRVCLDEDIAVGLEFQGASYRAV